MNKFIALLRGINVSGQKLIKMSDLKLLFLQLGFKGIETYIQSGNVIFSSTENDIAKIRKEISSGIKKEFGFDVQVIVITSEEIKKTIKNNPFIKLRDDTEKLYVVFLSTKPSEENIKELTSVNFKPEEYSINDKDIYLYVPNGYGKAKLNNNFFETKLKVYATTRNWKTVNKLSEIAANLD